MALHWYLLPSLIIFLFINNEFAMLLLLLLFSSLTLILKKKSRSALLALKNLQQSLLSLHFLFFSVAQWGRQLFWLAFQLDSKSYACWIFSDLFSFFYKLPWLFSMVSSIWKMLQWFREQGRNIYPYIFYIMYQPCFGKRTYPPLRTRYDFSIVH